MKLNEGNKVLLFFTESNVPTPDELAAIRPLQGEYIVRARNGAAYVTTEFEKCDAVAGAVPPGFVDHPMAGDVTVVKTAAPASAPKSAGGAEEPDGTDSDDGWGTDA